ncbi:hypothetical protein KCTC52924_03312 [Arenibacter antarcticus]|uniref:LTXXQ motif family protein n=1 Tax=Arenibacter antarcticus TaxID=2040469 RepID=A0ABW5VIR5_9FLAO|nr:hypothetical protein [Arenibacter sp. H213]MCM4166379.1 hypothetical protein [Arenibacter sp. H213]
MKKRVYCTLCVLCIVSFFHECYAQTSAKDSIGEKPLMPKATLLEIYEPNMVISERERNRLKNERITEEKRRRSILDTLDIGEGKRKRLIRDIYKDPFSERLLKALATAKLKAIKD